MRKAKPLFALSCAGLIVGVAGHLDSVWVLVAVGVVLARVVWRVK